MHDIIHNASLIMGRRPGSLPAIAVALIQVADRRGAEVGLGSDGEERRPISEGRRR